MTWPDSIKNINKKTLIIFFLDILLLITPGVLYLFLHQKGLFVDLDFPKLLTLSISINIPLVIFNFFIFLKKDSTFAEMSTEEIYKILTLAIFASALVTYVSSGLYYFLKPKPLFGININIIYYFILFEVVVLIENWWENRKFKKQQKFKIPA